MKFNGLRDSLSLIRELDLRKIKVQAESEFELLICGEPEAARRLATSLSAAPGRSGAHPWITVLAAGDSAGLTTWLASGAEVPRLALILLGETLAGPGESDARQRLRTAGVPVVTVQLREGAGAALAPGGEGSAAAGAEIPSSAPPVDAWPSLGAEPGPDELRAGLAPALLRVMPEGQALRLALPRQLPVLRLPFIEDLVEDTARANATYSLTTGLGAIAPVLSIPLTLTDFFILTKNQLVMAYKIALISGRRGSPTELMGEVSGVIGAGLLFRQLARELVGFIPLVGLPAKVAVAYAGTRIIGRVVQIWALEGRAPAVGELHSYYQETVAAGRALAERLVARGRPEAEAPAAPALPAPPAPADAPPGADPRLPTAQGNGSAARDEPTPRV